LAALGFAGANVTVPHKSAILPYLDELSPVAGTIGAVNTLVVRSDGTILGDNTDAYGFMAGLLETGWTGSSLSDRLALVIGAGGAARAVTYGLLEAGAAVAVVNRSFDRAVELCRTLGSLIITADPAATARLSAHRFPEDLAVLSSKADLIVNATRLGLHGSDDPLPWARDVAISSGQLVYDLVYSPVAQTPFLALASSAGAQVRDGLSMLVHQGARSFRLWTGREAPVEVMRAALVAEAA
jgi:shikimate dehydrogenase